MCSDGHKVALSLTASSFLGGLNILTKCFNKWALDIYFF